MMRNKDFARDYGVLIQDGPLAGICARAIVVLDKNNKVDLYTACPRNYDGARLRDGS